MGFLLNRLIDFIGLLLTCVAGILISTVLTGGDMLTLLNYRIGETIFVGLVSSSISGYIFGRIFQKISYVRHKRMMEKIGIKVYDDK